MEIVYDGHDFTGDIFGCFYDLRLESASEDGRSVSLYGQVSGGPSNCADWVDMSFGLEGENSAWANGTDSYDVWFDWSLERVA